MFPKLAKSTLAAGLVFRLTQLILAQEMELLPESCTPATDATYPSNTKLPDPFQLADGSRLSTTEKWACKRAEIRSQIETWELGPKFPPPAIEAYMFGDTIAIVCSYEGRSVEIDLSVRVPGGYGPHPVIISLGDSLIPVPENVALISFNNHAIAADGQGKFYDLYGSGHEVGGLMAWAWGVSRIIDALEILEEGSDLDLSRIGVTGCSMNGTGALIAGAFDDRIALTMPQEGGSGGPGCWRIANDMKEQGMKVEDSSQAVTGDGLFTPNFTETATNDISVLPYDHHMLMGLVAPRALLVVENSGIEYLGPQSTYGCSAAAKAVYEALGAGDNMGFTQVSHSMSHCQLPEASQPDVNAFFDKFFFNQSIETDFMKTDGNFESTLEEWVNWTLPVLT